MQRSFASAPRYGKALQPVSERDANFLNPKIEEHNRIRGEKHVEVVKHRTAEHALLKAAKAPNAAPIHACGNGDQYEWKHVDWHWPVVFNALLA